MTTELKVCLVGPGHTRLVVTIFAFAKVSVLRLLPYGNQVLSYGGQILDDTKSGLVHFIVPGCEISVNEKTSAPVSAPVAYSQKCCPNRYEHIIGGL